MHASLRVLRESSYPPWPNAVGNRDQSATDAASSKSYSGLAGCQIQDVSIIFPFGVPYASPSCYLVHPAIIYPGAATRKSYLIIRPRAGCCSLESLENPFVPLRCFRTYRIMPPRIGNGPRGAWWKAPDGRPFLSSPSFSLPALHPWASSRPGILNPKSVWLLRICRLK